MWFLWNYLFSTNNEPDIIPIIMDDKIPDNIEDIQKDVNTKNVNTKDIQIDVDTKDVKEKVVKEKKIKHVHYPKNKKLIEKNKMERKQMKIRRFIQPKSHQQLNQPVRYEACRHS